MQCSWCGRIDFDTQPSEGDDQATAATVGGRHEMGIEEGLQAAPQSELVLASCCDEVFSNLNKLKPQSISPRRWNVAEVKETA